MIKHVIMEVEIIFQAVKLININFKNKLKQNKGKRNVQEY